jgi:acetylornithine/succinyldiaminopimelate/putrescine aminotransferase
MYEGGHMIAAIFIETVTGTNGLIVPPDGDVGPHRELLRQERVLRRPDVQRPSDEPRRRGGLHRAR